MKSIRKLLLLLTLLFPLFTQAVGELYTQDKLDALNKAGKSVLEQGALRAASGVLLILSSADNSFEKWAVNAMPDWLVTLTSSY